MSTLVETISFNCEDFNESFLTCATCLCRFDPEEHIPKLLPCSHSICLQCLGRIAENRTSSGLFRCPICRSGIPVPRGGVGALPPSFFINQLLDLMGSMKRDVIPQCSVHAQQELLFCESCDGIFCSKCGNNENNTGDAMMIQGKVVQSFERLDCDHKSTTVVPLSIAIKRMSQIMFYKAQHCVSRLEQGEEEIANELRQLEHRADETAVGIKNRFARLREELDERQRLLEEEVYEIKEQKKMVLEEQLEILRNEKERVEKECALGETNDMHKFSERIAGLSQMQLDVLCEPRENSYFRYQEQPRGTEKLLNSISDLGRVTCSRTLPGLCQLKVEEPLSAGLLCTATLSCYDYKGEAVTCGGDPVDAVVLSEDSSKPVKSKVEDLDNGKYQITFTPPGAGKLKLDVKLFGRRVKNCPLIIDVRANVPPICSFYGTDTALALCQPADLIMVPGFGSHRGEKHLYIVDTGNNRIVVVDASDFSPLYALDLPGMEEHGATGAALTPYDEGDDSPPNIVISNWRTKNVTECTLDGKLVVQFTNASLNTPMNCDVTRAGQILIADSGAGAVFMFARDGKLLRRFTSPAASPLGINAVCHVAGRNGQDPRLLIADALVRVYNEKGSLIDQFGGVAAPKPKKEEAKAGKLTPAKETCYYNGVALDDSFDDGARVLCTKMPARGRGACVEVRKMCDGELLLSIDSHGSRLKRPCGIALDVSCKHVFVVDTASNCVRKYRYV